MSGLSIAVVEAVHRWRINGIAVAASHDGSIEFACDGTIGGAPAAPDTVMYGASVTKQMIGFLLAIGVDAGRASPDDRVIRWLPELPDWTDGVRLHHLLHHTSGLPDLAAPSHGIPQSNEEVLDRFQRVDPPRTIDPGTQSSYNNAGYVLLAETVSRVFDRPIAQLAHDEIFGPLGMAATRLGGEPRRIAGQADPPGTIGDGGLWTTAADLIAWLTAMNNVVINSRVVQLVQCPGHLADGMALDYAWGVRVTETRYGWRVTHGGTWANWLAKTVRLPDQGIAVAVLAVGDAEGAISQLGIELAEQLASRRSR